MKFLVLLTLLWSSVEGEIPVKTNAKETARIGSDVTLRCQLMTHESNIIQITWHKESGNLTGNVASTSKVYGQKLLGFYSNRAKHSTNKTLNVSAITISPVIPEDEGCFKCIFNLFPYGASTGTICLDVFEPKILEPSLEVHEISQPDKQYIVTCSGGGIPAPDITWILPENLDVVPETFTVVNLDKTEIVISNFTLSSSWNMRVSVICVVRHPSLGSEKLLSTDIDLSRNQDLGFHFSPIVVILVGIVIVLGVLYIIHLVLRKN
ncbi:OX-2 membrane glycoprotein-like [Bufo bufo]|uniref:OX-2 membrane glycoprotein-like n=1 Tax=Bufo bufo TaxID=8384 RepID=UPI001ABEA3E4|nr:OX-2 membrane glycoprotein-like [Bufo bufo]